MIHKTPSQISHPADQAIEDQLVSPGNPCALPTANGKWLDIARGLQGLGRSASELISGGLNHLNASTPKPSHEASLSTFPAKRTLTSDERDELALAVYHESLERGGFSPGRTILSIGASVAGIIAGSAISFLPLGRAISAVVGGTTGFLLEYGRQRSLVELGAQHTMDKRSMLVVALTSAISSALSVTAPWGALYMPLGAEVLRGQFIRIGDRLFGGKGEAE